MTKKFPAYINPGSSDGEWNATLAYLHKQLAIAQSLDDITDERQLHDLMEAIDQTSAMINSGLKSIQDARALAEIIGLKKGEYRLYNGVIWLKPWLPG